MQVTIDPGPLQGRLPAIPSKSHAHRLLLCAALADGPSRIKLTHSNNDIDATLACIEALGAKVNIQGEWIELVPLQSPASPAELRVRESGTTLRLLLPIVASLGIEAHFYAEGRLPERPLNDLVETMTARGAVISSSWPLKVQEQMQAGCFRIPGNISSQYISGLLMAAPLLDGEVRIELSSPLESRPYVDLTIAVMEAFGVRVESNEDSFIVPADQSYQAPKDPIIIEGDWSQAAFFLVAGALSGPVTLTDLNLNSSQGDKAILDYLKDFGAKVDVEGNSITVSQGHAHPLHANMTSIPDLLPILSVLACGAHGESLLDDALRLRYKESDRLDSTEALLLGLGGKVESSQESLTIFGRGHLHGGKVDAYRDHRIVMAAAIAGTLCQEPILINGAEAVTKSYPAFFRDLKSLGGQVHEL